MSFFLSNGNVVNTCHYKKRKVLRFVNYRLLRDPENYYREKLLFYTHWHNEGTDLIKDFHTYEEAFNTQKCEIAKKLKRI